MPSFGRSHAPPRCPAFAAGSARTPRSRGLAVVAAVAALLVLAPRPVPGQALKGTTGGAPPAATGEPAVARGAEASLRRARAAQAQGDLRTAQIEYRNAVRNDPGSGFLRLALAGASLDLGDWDTAEKEARAALDRGYDPGGSTAVLLRAYLASGRHAELLAGFPQPDATTAPAVAGQIAAARGLARLATGDRAAARAEIDVALRVAPGLAQSHFAASLLAGAEGDRPGALAAADRAQAIEPDHAEALQQKARLLFAQGDRTGAIAALDRVIAQRPGSVPARIQRAEAYLLHGDAGAARRDVEAALRSAPGSVPALYLLAVLQTRAQDWRGADETLQRLGPVLPGMPDGLLMQATVKRALGQADQARDAAQRFAARRPEDPRGARLLAALALEQGQPLDAIGALERVIQRGAGDMETFDLLARAQQAAGRPAEAAAALARAAAIATEDAALRVRLASLRLGIGDAAGAAAAARDALRLAPEQVAARELLITALLAGGELAGAEAELAAMSPEARRRELPSVAAATLRIARLDPDGARAGFEDALRRMPESLGARLGLAKLALRDGAAAEAVRQWHDVLRRDPSNAEALAGLALVAQGEGPDAAAARAALEATHAAAPAAPAPLLTLANALIRTGGAGRALALLDADAVQNGPLRSGGALALLRAEALGGLDRWPEAEAAIRAALTEEPDNRLARRELAVAMARNGDSRGAEEGLRATLGQWPDDAALQQTLVGLVREGRGLDAALEVAAAIGGKPGATPAARALRGDLLMAAQRPAEAAPAYAAAFTAAPDGQLARRAASAWLAAGDANRAAAALDGWLARAPRDAAALGMRAALDLQDGRLEAAIGQLDTLVDLAPEDAVALNNLAWALAQRSGAADLPRARDLALRAHFLRPAPETAGTLGWVLARNGEAPQAVPLLRQATARRPGAAVDPGAAYRLAFALEAAGQRAEARDVLEPVLADAAPFPERAEAERLLASLRAGR
jgi:putative PEP-CTERM system TPR-repeat lipoprotein